ncbi:MAG TPA: ABC transporter ATP-binding protein [Geminicoccus sp.]|jgi:multiple sugar transport system ATP-binding protein|uniref:ABC transporter ATP-binding protein n=1 Tax=Geminicoccus sp. TaxID=2024832 RepID=UPI002E33B39D|nr:ABC transporter ATP-binding protein [Geminicoccus sp.]HEX2528944.1 ABC transporter ATP-binding protein [Geminicoccus sp.]
MAELNLIAVDKIYQSRGKPPVHAVQGVDMRIADGEIIGLLGSSGCGKTSTLRMIAGFEEVSRGEIRLGTRLLNDLGPAERGVAMAFEGYALYPPLTVRDNIVFALLRAKTPRAEIDRRVAEIAALLEIEEILDRYPPTISAGQQQRTSLARALVRRADLSLLDEPMSQLEPQLRAILRARIKDFLIQHKMTTVFVTHDQTEALALADRIAVMEGGVLQQFATPADLKEQPANLFVASFIGEPPMNIMEAEVIESDIVVRTQRNEKAFILPAFPGDRPGDVRVGIRPHRLKVGTGPLQGQVVSNQWLGDQTHLGIEVAGVLLVAVTDGALSVDIGEHVPVDLPGDALHLFDAAMGKALRHGMGPVA